MKGSVENELLAVIRRLEKRIAEQDAAIAELKAKKAARGKRLAELETEIAKSKKDSSTSSKPPTSDIVKPPREVNDGENPQDRSAKGMTPAD